MILTSNGGPEEANINITSEDEEVNIQISNKREEERQKENREILIKIKTVSGGIVVFGGKNTIAPITITPAKSSEPSSSDPPAS